MLKITITTATTKQKQLKKKFFNKSNIFNDEL